MKREVIDYVSNYLMCQQVKAEHQVTSGLPLMQRKHDAISVIIDRLMKSAHFVLVQMDYFMARLVELYVDEIFRLHGLSLSIVLDRDPRFKSRFWNKL